MYAHAVRPAAQWSAAAAHAVWQHCPRTSHGAACSPHGHAHAAWRVHAKRAGSEEGTPKPQDPASTPILEIETLKSKPSRPLVRTAFRRKGLSEEQLKELKAQRRRELEESQRRHENLLQQAKGEVQRKRVVIVDGYNVLFKDEGLTNLMESYTEAARGALISWIDKYAQATQQKCVLVFDAMGGREQVNKVSQENSTELVQVVFTGASEADTWIVRYANNPTVLKTLSVVIVSDDSRIKDETSGLDLDHTTVIDASAFLEDLRTLDSGASGPLNTAFIVPAAPGRGAWNGAAAAGALSSRPDAAIEEMGCTNNKIEDSDVLCEALATIVVDRALLGMQQARAAQDAVALQTLDDAVSKSLGSSSSEEEKEEEAQDPAERRLQSSQLSAALPSNPDAAGSGAAARPGGSDPGACHSISDADSSGAEGTASLHAEASAAPETAATPTPIKPQSEPLAQKKKSKALNALLRRKL